MRAPEEVTLNWKFAPLLGLRAMKGLAFSSLIINSRMAWESWAESPRTPF